MDDDVLQRMKEITSYDSYKFDDFSDSCMNVYDESSPNVFDLEGCGEESTYSGPIFQDLESPLSIYGGENHHNADVSAASFADSFTMFNSLCTKASPSQLSLTSCSESYSLPVSPSPQENAKSTLPISKRQLFGNFVMEKNGPPETQNSGFSSYHGTSSLDSYRSFPSSINELLYRKLHPPKSEANYLLKIRCPENHKDDGYKWRKYGQKAIKNSPYPRSYYRCTSPKCRAKKQVEKCVEDPQTLTITYEGLHLHYSYSPLMQITQQPNYSLRQPENNIYERIIKRKAVTETIWNESFKNSSKSPAMVAAHQQLQKEKDGLFESLQFGREKSDVIIMDGVVEEEYGGGRRDGLLQDIVPLGIINPLSSSSSSSTSSSASQ